MVERGDRRQRAPRPRRRGLRGHLIARRSRLETIYHLNVVGAALWRLLVEPIGLDQAVAILQAAYPDVAKPQIERDAAALIADLAARGLLADAP